jgi:hypothetical protein
MPGSGKIHVPAEVEQQAKKKGVEIVNSSQASKRNCMDCNSVLLEGNGTWYEEHINYFDDPMIKYWITWSKELSPAAYSWPSSEKKYRCTKCFDDFNISRTKLTATREQATKAAAKVGIKMYADGPFFPFRVRLTNRGWYSSADMAKNNKQLHVCWDVNDGSLVPLAYKVAGQIDVYVCVNCYKKNGEKI